MDWGTGTVMSAIEADGADAMCDACGLALDHGLVIEIVLRPFDSAAEPQGLATVCEGCFEDVTSDLGVDTRPGTEFLVLAVPDWA